MSERRMNKRAWKRYVRSLILGAINGAFFSAMLASTIWGWRAYIYKQELRVAEAKGIFPAVVVYNERWSTITIAWIILFSLSALVVNLLWPRDRDRYFLFWQAVGVGALGAWNVIIIGAAWFEREFSDRGATFDRVTSPLNPLFGPISIGAVIVVNLVFALVIRTFSKKLESSRYRQEAAR